MRTRLAKIALACAAQYAAVGLGTIWGFQLVHGVRWPQMSWALSGELAVLLLGADGLRLVASRRLKLTRPVTAWLCLALAVYAISLMVTDAFLYYTGDTSFVTGVLLLVPFLLCLGALTHAGAWLGVAGSILLVATSLAMLICNGYSVRGGFGFFSGWMS